MRGLWVGAVFMPSLFDLIKFVDSFAGLMNVANLMLALQVVCGAYLLLAVQNVVGSN